MTAISQPRTLPVGRTTPTSPARRIAGALARAIASLGGRVSAMGRSGQFGPDPETEIGRYTGARI